MNALKYILIGISGLVVLLLLVALFVEKKYTIKREVTINKPTPEVFAYVKHLRNQDKYSKWVMTDPNMKKSFRGEDGNVGFVYGWNGNDQAGEGEQEITGLKEGERVDIEIRFKRPMENVARTPIITEAVAPDQTKVTWAMEGESKYPLNLMNLFMDKLLGKDMETSLGTLKGILEK